MFEINMLPQARALIEAGDVDAARELLERAVEGNRAALAEGEPGMLAAMRELAGLRSRGGDLMGARRLLEEAQAAGHRLSPADPLAVMLSYDLGTVAEQLANRHVARTNFATVAEHGPAALGEDHSVVERARAYLDDAEPAGAEREGSAQQSPTPLIVVPDTPPVATAPAPPPPGPIPPLPTSARPAGEGAGPKSAGPKGAGPKGAGPKGAGPKGAGPKGAGPKGAGPESGEGPDASNRPSRKPWIFAAAGIAVGATVAATVLLARPDDATPAGVEVQAQAQTQAPAATTAATKPATAQQTSAPQSTAPQTTRAQAAPRKTTAPATKTTAPATETTAPATKAPTVATRIVSPANGSKVPYPFDARFTVSPADAASRDTVVALLVCVAGRCYLDGKLDIIDGAAAPYTIYLGSTKPEGTGVAWSLRLDRLSTATYGRLIAEREARWNDGSWGDKGTTMSLLNPTPVSTLTVVKTGA
ncbi:class I SAM-dependent methyltransferase [Paractinoplanes deccanensis]|uniref:tetratricopeptide repeat protein n=1 Tax=Paractinoplanes deccanensis TaxID=113561 RepID=UPI0019455B21|nr:tetratricopeptide repeat protein [Actinoplanes deccanensis]